MALNMFCAGWAFALALKNAAENKPEATLICGLLGVANLVIYFIAKKK